MDSAERRVRRPIDLVRLCLLAVVLVLLLALGVFAHRTMSASSEDLARALNHLPRPLTRVLSFAAGLLIVVLSAAYVINLLVHRAVRLLLDALVAGLIALALVWTLGELLTSASHTALYRALRLSAHNGTTVPVDGYLAAVAAFGVAGGMTRRARWRWYYAGTLIVYAASALLGSQASLLALALSLVAGATVALGLRYAVGALDQRPSAERIADVLIDRDIPLGGLRPQLDPHSPYRQFGGETAAGPVRVVVLDRDLVPSGLVHRLYRMLRVRREVAGDVGLSMERAAERRVLLTLLAQRARLATPQLIAGVPCGADAVVLVYTDVPAEPITEVADDLRDAQLVELWRGIVRLHETRVTHRELTPERLSVDEEGIIWVASPTEGAAFASGLRINLDRAELLITTTRLVGAARAVAVAREVLGAARLSSVRPVLQRIAFSERTRAALRRDRQPLTSLVDELDAQLSSSPPLSDLERVRPRTLLVIVASLIAAYLLVGQLGSLDLATVFTSVRWGWVPVVLAGSALTYLGSALVLIGLVRERLSFATTTLAQLASGFAGFIAPASVGVMALNIQYLRKSGIPTAGAATSIAVNQVVGVVSYFVLIVIFGVASGTGTGRQLPIPGWAFIVLAVAVALALLVLAMPRAREWISAKVLPMAREVLPRLAYTASRPVKLAQVVGGTLALNAGYILALAAAVAAFGGDVAIATVAVVYLAGGAIGSAAPTPGGLGAVEAALAAGLAAAGMPGASAVSAVLLFRIATFWLPVPFGWLAYTALRRRDLI